MLLIMLLKCSLQNFTDCFTAFVDRDIIERCQQERQLLEKLLEEVCTYICIAIIEFCHPDIK